MSEEYIEKKWEKIKKFFISNFDINESLELETILYLIGIRELGTGKLQFEKEDKIDLIYMATCKLLEPLGYFQFEKKDDFGWSYFKQLKKVDNLSEKQQYELLKKSSVMYFDKYVW